VAYLGEQIERHFGDGANFGVHVEYSYEASPLGTGGALKNAERKLDAEFVVLNGDTFLDIDYRRLFSDFERCNCAAMTVAFENSDGALQSNMAFNMESTVTTY